MNWTTEISNKEYLEFTNYYSSTTRGPRIYVINGKEYHSNNFYNLTEDEFELVYESIIQPNLYKDSNNITLGKMNYGDPYFPRMLGFFDVIDSVEMFIYSVLNLAQYYKIHITDMCWDENEKKLIYCLWID